MTDTVDLETLLRMELGQLLVLRELVVEAVVQRTQAEPLERVVMRMPMTVDTAALARIVGQEQRRNDRRT